VNGLAHLARFVAESRRRPMPGEARELAKLALVDFAGCALAGAGEPVARMVAKTCAPGASTVIGHAMRARAADAAFANATSGHAHDFDDSNMVLGGHPSVVLYPAALAIGEEAKATGAQVLDAYIAGFEVIMAIARAVNFEHYEKGWHPTATLGVFGAAAAAASLLALDETQCAHALGLAASMSSGVKANFGTGAKPLQVGEASRRGVLCAQLAAEGATSSANALEGKQGFFEVYNGAGRYRANELASIGDGLELLGSGYKFKKYPCCGSTHAPVDAASALKKQHGFAASDIAGVRVAMNARRRPHVDRPVVADELAAKFSVQFTVAAALADGGVGLRHFTDASIRRPDLQDLLKRVELADLEGGNAALAQACEVTVQMHSGATHSLRVEDAQGRGADAYPTYMKSKFADCVRLQFGAEEAGALADSLLAIDRCGELGPLVGRLATPSRREEP
jgi:2-methylcitrate dehydratase PrpD